MDKPYLNKIDFKNNPPAPISSDEPSQTVQDEAREIADIMEQYTLEQVAKSRRYDYLDVPDIETIDKFFQPGALDFTDLDELERRSKQINATIDRTLQKINEEREQQEAEQRQQEQQQQQAKNEV